MKALLVDPDPQRAPALAKSLESSGAEVSIAPSASFALTMLEWNKQDVIVSRARLGDMEGHELCAIVRSDPSTKDVRFVLVVGPGEHSPAQTATAGVDLLLPDALSNATMVTRVVQLVRRHLESSPVAPPPSLARRPAPAPQPIAAEPTIDPAPMIHPAPTIDPAPTIEPAPTIYSAPTVEPALTVELVPTVEPVATVESAPTVEPEPRIDPGPRIESRPMIEPAPTLEPAPIGTQAPAPFAPAMAGLDSVGTNGGARTFQGALGVLEIEELTQAIAIGGKTGRLVLVLNTGGGLVVFESGRVTHAEFGGQGGEAAFAALVAASHRERGGKFCFIPLHPNELRSQPKTILRGVEQLLLDVARAMDEERRA